MNRITVENGDQIPSDFGPLRKAVRKSTVRIREPRLEGETFETSWGTLTASPGEDLVIIQDNGDEYPIKRGIFAETYIGVEKGRYRKTATSRLIQVPEGITVVLKSKEGDIEVQHPDYVVIGAQNEVYANNPDWIESNLDFLD